MSTPRLYRVIIPVADIEQAAHFYGTVFAVNGERVSPGRHYFDCGGTTLALKQAYSKPISRALLRAC